MIMEKQNTKHRGLGALDIFIILALVAVIAGVGIRAYVNSSDRKGEVATQEDYVVSFQVLDIRDSSNERHMHEGDKFYLKDSGMYFGSLLETNTVTAAEAFYELPDGTIYKGVNTGSGDHYRVDVEADILAQGMLDQTGAFLLGGNTYLGMNKEIQIYSKYLSITVKITGIAKAS